MVNAFARRTAPGALFLVATLALSGCGGNGFKLTPAEGVIKIGGKPAANLSVQFLPDVMKGATGPTSYGTTDAEGKFRLKTYDGQDGAVVGAHNVILADLDEERPPQGVQLKKQPRLDSKYTTTKGDLRAEVTEGGAPIVVELGR